MDRAFPLAHLSAQHRTLIARRAAYARWSKEDPHVALRAVRARSPQSLQYFLRDVDPDLPEQERIRRAECARRAYFVALSLCRVNQARARKAKP